MFGLKRRIQSRTIDAQAGYQLRGLGLSQIEAMDVIHKVRELYKDARFTKPDDVVAATPSFHAAGLSRESVRRALHAAAILAHITGTDYEYMAQILMRIASAGRITMQEVAMLRRRGVPLWLLHENGLAFDQEKIFLADVKAGLVTHGAITNAILDQARGLEV